MTKPSRFAAPFLWLLSCTVVGCGETGSGRLLSVEELRSHAIYTISDSEENGTPLADPASVHPLGADSVLVIDAVDPFIRLYGENGVIRAEFVKQGSGPGEMTRPSAGVISGDTLFVVDRAQGTLLRLSMTSFEEIGRGAVPPSFAAMFGQCDGSGLNAVAQLVRPQRTPEQDAGQVQNYTIARLQGGTWQLTKGDWPDFDFVPSPNRFGVAAKDGRVAIHNNFHSRIEFVSCESGEILESVSIPYPEEWRIPPHPQGLVWAGDEVIAFFSGATRALQDTTYVALWQPGAPEVVVRRVNGRVSIHATTDSAVWLVDNNVAPIPFAVPMVEFRRYLGLK